MKFNLNEIGLNNISNLNPKTGDIIEFQLPDSSSNKHNFQKRPLKIPFFSEFLKFKVTATNCWILENPYELGGFRIMNQHLKLKKVLRLLGKPAPTHDHFLLSKCGTTQYNHGDWIYCCNPIHAHWVTRKELDEQINKETFAFHNKIKAQKRMSLINRVLSVIKDPHSKEFQNWERDLIRDGWWYNDITDISPKIRTYSQDQIKIIKDHIKEGMSSKEIYEKYKSTRLDLNSEYEVKVAIDALLWYPGKRLKYGKY